MHKRVHSALPGESTFSGSLYLDPAMDGNTVFSLYIFPERQFYPTVTLYDPNSKTHHFSLTKDFDAFEGMLSHQLDNVAVSDTLGRERK